MQDEPVHKLVSFREHAHSLDLRRGHLSPRVRRVHSQVAESGRSERRFRAPGRRRHPRATCTRCSSTATARRSSSSSTAGSTRTSSSASSITRLGAGGRSGRSPTFGGCGSCKSTSAFSLCSFTLTMNAAPMSSTVQSEVASGLFGRSEGLQRSSPVLCSIFEGSSSKPDAG